ncbi:MAG TPA: aspartate--ammonia ligase, partial [Bacteroidia bacterium]|nr:aspartate--ammonia ligase [Bacteroidia bacterium]
RTLVYLQKTVIDIYSSILETEALVCSYFPKLKPFLRKEIHFVHSEDLQKKYPGLSAKQRENEIAKNKGAVFIIGIGGALDDGKPHDSRAPDYDDWITPTIPGRKGLNGDIVVWNPVLNRAFEISSMGIRVSPETLTKQLQISGNEERLALKWHRQLVEGELPCTIGGGIGQSRLAMLLLQKQHIGEVQPAIWPEEITELLAQQEIILLS